MTLLDTAMLYIRSEASGFGWLYPAALAADSLARRLDLPPWPPSPHCLRPSSILLYKMSLHLRPPRMACTLSERWATPRHPISSRLDRAASTTCELHVPIVCRNVDSPATCRYLHLGFKAHERITKRSRVCTVWAILRLRHPLLCARAEMHDYDDVRFV